MLIEKQTLELNVFMVLNNTFKPQWMITDDKYIDKH